MPESARPAAGTVAGTLRLNTLLAWRLFGAGRREALVSMISTISIVGMMIAVALLVLVLSVMNGFEREFRSRILGLVPHARVWLEQPANMDATVIEAIANDRAVRSVLPFIEFKALATAGTQARPLLVQGTDVGQFLKLARGYVTVAEAQPPMESLANGELILGTKLAARLGVAHGASVRLMVVAAANGQQTGRKARTLLYPMRVAGLLDTGTELDESVAIMHIADAARIKPSTVALEGLQLQFHNVFAARDLSQRVALNYGLRGRMSDWTREYGNLYTAIQLSRQLVVLLLASIIAVAVFNVFITLGMVVRHKRPEIAILRSMGLARRHVLHVFVWQGLLISLLGCGLGLLLGSALAMVAPHAVGALQGLFGYEFLSTEIYPINYLPAQLRAADLLLISAIALGMSLLATLVPAWRAARLQPAEVLNGSAR